MFDDLLDDIQVFYDAYDFHGPGTLGTCERIDFIDLLDETHPVFPALL